MMLSSRNRAALLMMLAVLTVARPAAAASDDAGSGADAGDTFETALHIPSEGEHVGLVDFTAGDTDDFYKFTLEEGESTSILVTAPATQQIEPVTLLDPNGIPVDIGTKALRAAGSSSLLTQENEVRVSVHRAVVSGDYRLHLQASRVELYYSFCFLNCEPFVDAPSDLIFGGSLKKLHTSVLLIPPAHGDLGDPTGPTVADYLDTTLRAIRTWTRVMADFADKYPEYAYLKQIEVDIEIFDEADPVDPVGYDVVIGYVAAGPAFRGVATDTDGFLRLQEVFAGAGLSDVHYSGRYIALSLFGSSPRAGQVLYDFPALDDLEIVTIHEFGHTFGLGHTTTWTPTYGPDIMNSPAPFVYGNGSAIGDGGERTGTKCLSSVNLIGMAELYRWIPSGVWQPSFGTASPPDGMPYEWFC